MRPIIEILKKLPFIGGFFSEGSMRQSSLNLFLAQAIYTFTIFFIDVLLAHSLSQDDFGIWKHILLIANLSALILLGLPQGFNYYANLEKERRRAHFNNVLAAISIVASILFIALIIGANKVIGQVLNNEFIIGAALLYPFIVIAAGLYNVLVMLSVIDKRTNLMPKANVLFTLLYISGICIISYLYISSDLVPVRLAVLIVGALLISHIARTAYLFVKHRIKFERGDINYNQILKYLKYGIPIYLATFLGILNSYIDQIIVSNLESLATFGIYAVGAKGFPLISSVSVIVAQSIFPQLMVYQNRGQNENAQKLWLKASVKASYMLYPIIIVLMIFTPYLIRLIYGEDFSAAIEIFQTYLLVLVFRHNGYGRLLMIRDENKWLMIFMICAFIVNIIISLFLYSRIGIIGVVWGTIASTLVNVILILSKERLLLRYLKTFFIDHFMLGIMILFLLLSILYNWF